MLLRLRLLMMLWVITHAATVNEARSRIIISIAVVNIPHPVHLITLFRGTVAVGGGNILCDDFILTLVMLHHAQCY